ncbi:MAG: hypothetical protein ACTSRA_00705 [Promethearchaeota archaeon]|nr:MAG: hypothetical protein [Helarchaeota virus Nidhogg Meg22_1214]
MARDLGLPSLICVLYGLRLIGGPARVMIEMLRRLSLKYIVLVLNMYNKRPPVDGRKSVHWRFFFAVSFLNRKKSFFFILKRGPN